MWSEKSILKKTIYQQVTIGCQNTEKKDSVIVWQAYLDQNGGKWCLMCCSLVTQFWHSCLAISCITG